MRAAVVGWGSAMPPEIVENAALAERLSLSAEWIHQRTGILRRHIAADTETTTALAARSGSAALEAAGLDAESVDLVILATTTPDQVLPPTASSVATAVGAPQAGAFDLSAACSGFLYALATAASLVHSGSSECALVVGADVLSRITDPLDAHTSILFGDAAGAAVVQRSSEEGLGPFVLRGDGSRAALLEVPPGGRFIQMQGREVYRSAIDAMVAATKEVLARARMSPSDVELFVAHQANARILTAVGERLGVPADRMATNIADVGNTSAASIPLAIDAAGIDLPDGAPVLMTAFGAGFIWGAGLLRWKNGTTSRTRAVAGVSANA